MPGTALELCLLRQELRVRGLSLAKAERQDPRAATAAGQTSQGAVQGRAPGAGSPPSPAPCCRPDLEGDPGTSSICWQPL